MRRAVLPLLCVVFLSPASHVLAQPSLEQRWAELFNAGDFATLMTLYLDDATFRGNDGTLHEGRAAIRQYLQGVHEAGYRAEIASTAWDPVSDTVMSVQQTVRWSRPGSPAVLMESMATLHLLVEGEWRIGRCVGTLRGVLYRKPRAA